MGVKQSVTQADVKALYQRLPSLLPWLPWQEYLPEEQVFVLEDSLSVGVMFEVQSVGVEARGKEFIAKVKRDIENLFNTVVPQEDPPFLLTIVGYNEDSMRQLDAAHRQYVLNTATESKFAPYTEAYLDMMSRHFESLSRAEGYFDDTAVTKQPWKGITRTVKCFLYRRLNKPSDVISGYSPITEINDVYESVLSSLSDGGMKVTRQGNKELYEWLFPWFNQSPEHASKADFLKDYPYPGDEDLPFGVNLNSMLFLEQPESYAEPEKGHWRFASGYHKALSIDGLRRMPEIGHLSAELTRGDKHFALMDKLPADTWIVLTIAFVPKDQIESHITQVKNNSRGDHHEAKATLNQAERALAAIAAGNNLFPTSMTLLARAPTEHALHRRVSELQSLMVQNGFSVVNTRDDLLPVNQYIRAMPFNYDYRIDKDERRNRLIFASHLANLAPFYGRSRGTNHPGIVFFNRGGEDISLDFIRDRSNNAFGTVIGPPGSGKSSWLNLFVQYVVAVHNARVFVFEKGGSFELQATYAEEKGLSVNQVTLKPDSDVSMPLFNDALKLAVDEAQKKTDALSIETDEEIAALDRMEKAALEGLSEEDASRDLLGEMELAAKLMITGGERKEVEALRRSDRRMIRAAIRKAGRDKLKQIQENPEWPADKHCVLPEDITRALWELSRDPDISEDARIHTEQMASSMELFCDGIAGKFFNRPGQSWREADITIMEFGILAQDDDYQDSLMLSFISLMNHINFLVERDETQSRPTVIIGDEAHLYLKFPLLAMYIVKAVKMWRKLGAWLWLATQNLDDMSEESAKLLRMFEWMLALTPPKGEIEAISQIRELTPEQKTMLRSARKEKGKFTEGVLLSDQFTALFRSVPPPEIFALGMTEKDEKTRRQKIMDETGCSKLEAAMQMAKDMAGGKR